jgi:hypothetical protein
MRVRFWLALLSTAVGLGCASEPRRLGLLDRPVRTSVSPTLQPRTELERTEDEHWRRRFFFASCQQPFGRVQWRLPGENADVCPEPGAKDLRDAGWGPTLFRPSPGHVLAVFEDCQIWEGGHCSGLRLLRQGRPEWALVAPRRAGAVDAARRARPQVSPNDAS